MKKTTVNKHIKNSKEELLEPAKKSSLALLLSLILAGIAFLLYANTLSHDYTVDDATVLANNKQTIQGVKAIPDIFTSSYRKGFWDRKESLYRPLSVAMFAIEWQIAPNNPHLSHWINVILYAITGAVLFVFLKTLFNENKIYLAFFVALLFIVHPIHTEVVANIKGRDEILSFLFSVLAMFFLTKGFDKKNMGFNILCGTFFLLALLSKESALTLIAIAPLLLLIFRGANFRSAVISASPFFVSALVYLIIRASVLGGISNFTEILPINNSLVASTDFVVQKATAIFILGKYLLLLFIPHPLSFDYSFNRIANRGFADAGVLISLLFFLYVLFFSIKNIGKRNVSAFGILFFLITISLTSNIFFLIESVMAERFLYLPSLGFCIALIFLFTRVFKFSKVKIVSSGISGFFNQNKTLSLVILSICLLFSVKTISRNNDWKNNLTLLAQDVKTCPESARIRYAYGSAILIEQALKEKDESKKQRLLRMSIEQLEKGVAILNTYADAYYHLGLAYKEKNDFTNAVKNFEAAMRSKNFTGSDFFIAAGVAYGENKQYEKSIETLRKAAEFDASNAEIYNNMGVYFDDWGKGDSAIAVLQKAILLDSLSAKPYYNMGNTFAHAHDFEQAVTFYKKSLSIDGGNIDAINNIGNCYAAQKNYMDALTYFLKAFEKDSANSRAINNIGVTYMMLGDKAKGDYYLQKLKNQ